MQPPRSQRLILLGGSTRAAAESARRAGYSVLALDAFGDEDLRETAVWQPLGRSSERVVEQLRALPPAGIVLTGGGERWLPHIAADPRLAPRLLAPDPAQLSELRSLDRLADFGRATRFPLPAIRDVPPPAGSRQRWLWKPRESLGGIGIRPPGAAPGEEGYWQRFLPGRAYGASFLATPRGEARLLGICRMLRRWRKCPGDRFAYAGSAGPLRMPPTLADQLRVLGERVVRHTGLRGLFGVDLLRDVQGRWWLLEINPRYTASMELLDNGPTPLVAMHCAAVQDRPATGWGTRTAEAAPRAALRDHRFPQLKLILYARRTLRLPPGWDWRAWDPQAAPDPGRHVARSMGRGAVTAGGGPAAIARLRFPRAEYAVELADRPSIPATVGAGEPLLTVLGRGPSLSPLLRFGRDLSAAIHQTPPAVGETLAP